jgi:hypothetical protein
MLIAGFYVYVYWGLTQAVKPITKADMARLDAAFDRAQKLANEYRKSGSLIKVDDASVGFPRKENDLRTLDAAIGRFRIRFDRLPANLRELVATSSTSDSEAQKKALQRLEGRCELFTMKNQSYVLTCDRGHALSEEAISRLVGADSETQKFYLLESRVLLYVPAFP